MRTLLLALVFSTGLVSSANAGSDHGHHHGRGRGDHQYQQQQFPSCTATNCSPAPFTYFSPYGGYQTYLPYYRPMRRFSLNVSFNGQAIYGSFTGGGYGSGYGTGYGAGVGGFQFRPMYPVRWY